MNGDRFSHDFLSELLGGEQRALSDGFVELVDLITECVSEEVAMLSSALVLLYEAVVLVLCILTNTALDLMKWR